MKKIKIFLGSSITEFEKERNDLELFIRNVSDEFEEKYNIKLVPLRCENMDNYVREDGTQKAINEELVLGSDMCFFIFFTKAGKFTEEEFKVAFEKFKKDGKPKIYIYFKNIPEGQTVEESVYDFMSKIDNELKHYHGSFDHIDTIKLRILLNLKLQEMDFVSVEFENGKCVVDGRETLDLSNVAEFANNGILQQLQKKLTEVEEQYVKMKRDYEKGNVNDAFYKEYAQIASKRQNLIDSIEELQKNIFNMSLRICKDEVYGDITIRQKEAYRLFELGDYEGAVSVLDTENIDNDFFTFEKQEEEKLRKKAQIYIKEHKTAIDILMTMINYQNRFNEIEERYEKIIKVAEKYSVNFDIIFDYAVFLDSQNNDNAKIFYKKIETLYEQQKDLFGSDFILTFFLKFSLYYISQRDIDKALIYAEKYIHIVGELYKKEPQNYFKEYALACILCPMIEKSSDKKTKTLQYLSKGEKVLKKQYVLSRSDNIKMLLAEYYKHIGLIYEAQKEYKTSEYFFLMGIKLFDESENKNRTVGDLYLNLAQTIILSDSTFDRNHEVFKYVNKSINIYEKLNQDDNVITQKIFFFDIFEEENAIFYTQALADAYNAMAKYYKDYEANYYWSIKYLRKSESLYKLLYFQNSNKYGIILAENYIHLAITQNAMNNSKRTDVSLRKGIEIFEKLYESNNERFAEDLSWAYSKAGMIYLSCNDTDYSFELFEKSLLILKKTNSETYISVYSERIKEILNFINQYSRQNYKADPKQQKFEQKKLNLLNINFRFIYNKINTITVKDPNLFDTLYEYGKKITTSYEKIDINIAREYYEMMVDVGKRILKTKDLKKDKITTISTEVAAMLGLLEKIDEGRELLEKNTNVIMAEKYYKIMLDIEQKILSKSSITKPQQNTLDTDLASILKLLALELS